MKRRILGKVAPRHRGQALVEMALGMVVLSLLLMGVLEFGLALYSYIVVVDATDEAAAYASLFPYERDTDPGCLAPCRINNDPAIIARVLATSRGNAAIDPTHFTVTVSPDYLDRDPCGRVTVETVYHYQSLMPFFFGAGFDMHYSASKMIVPAGSLGLCPNP
jgi:hypothetical protein